MVLQAIEERFGIIGTIVARLVGLAWNLVTFLVVPILVLEDLGVGDALKRSKDLFKKTWGENVIGQFGLGASASSSRSPASCSSASASPSAPPA